MKIHFRFYTATALLILYALLCGCSPDSTSLKVKSEPAGAYITAIDNGIALGVAPLTKEYVTATLMKKANKDEKAGCYLIKGFKARWISGATATTAPEIRLCKPAENSFVVTLKRNSNDPDLDKDVQFAQLDKDDQVKQQKMAEKRLRKALKPEDP